MFFVDSNLEAASPNLIAAIGAYAAAHPSRIELAAEPRTVPGGEEAKNDFSRIEKMAGAMLGLRLDRHSFVVAAGGGAVLDAVGFAASLVHRGLRVVRLPSTVLAQADGGVGVKNGINFAGGKNALGTFAPPFAVINDFDFLLSLSDREWRGGVAEAFKVALIRDGAFFDFLCASAARFRDRDFAAMQQLVVRCAELHLDHIRTSGDPFEFGRARPLDFGHWAAHKLEMLSGFEISHGEAVAVGMLADSSYAVARGWLEPEAFAKLHAGLAASGLPTWSALLGTPEIFDGLREFKEHLGGELCVTFPLGIGKRHEVHEIDLCVMKAAIEALGKMTNDE